MQMIVALRLILKNDNNNGLTKNSYTYNVICKQTL